jgi:hypothetical protein
MPYNFWKPKAAHGPSRNCAVLEWSPGHLPATRAGVDPCTIHSLGQRCLEAPHDPLWHSKLGCNWLQRLHCLSFFTVFLQLINWHDVDPYNEHIKLYEYCFTMSHHPLRLHHHRNLTICMLLYISNSYVLWKVFEVSEWNCYHCSTWMKQHPVIHKTKLSSHEQPTPAIPQVVAVCTVQIVPSPGCPGDPLDNRHPKHAGARRPRARWDPRALRWPAGNAIDLSMSVGSVSHVQYVY